jgi:hypothetical protein
MYIEQFAQLFIGLQTRNGQFMKGVQFGYARGTHRHWQFIILLYLNGHKTNNLGNAAYTLSITCKI